MELKKKLFAVAASAALSVVALASVSQPAAARVVCNDSGDCWHTDDNAPRYGSEVHAQYHPDDWYFHQHWDADKEHHYRDYHEGRGYYKDGVWVGE
jgi:hypothetical protein